MGYGLSDVVGFAPLLRRILITLACVAAFRLGTAVPLPGGALESANNGFLDLLSAGAAGRGSILSLGLLPSVLACLLMALARAGRAGFIVELEKDGEPGRRVLLARTRLLALALALPLAAALRLEPFGFVTLVAGAMASLWLAETITEQGVGNGTILLVAAGVARHGLASAGSLVAKVRGEELSLLAFVAIAAAVFAVFVTTAWVETAQRKLPVQYAKRMIGRKMYGGTTSALPLKVDQSGMYAVLFAAALMAAAALLGLEPGWTLGVLYAASIFLLCFLYNSSVINPDDLADNMKKSGGFVPGLRPGEPTARHIDWILTRITLGGALFATVTAIAPWLLGASPASGAALFLAAAGTLDLMGQVQTHLIMRDYEGVIRKGQSS
jgi:preprotein translocase subunit SecY